MRAIDPYALKEASHNHSIALQPCLFRWGCSFLPQCFTKLPILDILKCTHKKHSVFRRVRYEKTPQGLGDMLAGVSYGLGAMLPASILMLRWFLSRRGTAIGICAAGTGISAVVFSSILSALIERFSLRVCFYFEALMRLVNNQWNRYW